MHWLKRRLALSLVTFIVFGSLNIAGGPNAGTPAQAAGAFTANSNTAFGERTA